MSAAGGDSATDQQQKSALSTGSNEAIALATASELVSEPRPDGVDGGIDRIRETDILPLRSHEQSADQVDVDTETSGITIDQVTMLD
jgi:hypothetical protein